MARVHHGAGAEHAAAGVARRRGDVPRAARCRLKNGVSIVGPGNLPRRIHLRQALALVADIVDAAAGVIDERRCAALEAGKQKLAVAIVGVGQALQLVQAALQGGGDGGPVGIGVGAVARFHQHALDVLQHGGHALQGVFLHRQRLRGVRPAGRILRRQGDGLRHGQRAGGAQGVVRGGQNLGPGAQLLLRAQEIALQGGSWPSCSARKKIGC